MRAVFEYPCCPPAWVTHMSEGTKTRHPFALPLRCAWHCSLPQHPATGGGEEMRLISCPFSWVWFLFPGQPVPMLLGRGSLSQGVPGLLRCCRSLHLGSGDPVLGHCCPFLARGDGDMLIHPGQPRCLSLLLWAWKLFHYCPFQKEWFCCFQLVQSCNPVSMWYDNSELRPFSQK